MISEKTLYTMHYSLSTAVIEASFEVGLRYLIIYNASGDHRGGATPVPIPNTAVKPSIADGTAGYPLWESRTLPDFTGLLTKVGGPDFFRRLLWK